MQLNACTTCTRNHICAGADQSDYQELRLKHKIQTCQAFVESFVGIYLEVDGRAIN